MSHLLPCPFCGSKVRLMMPSYPLHADCGDAVVTCVECDANGPSVLIDMSVHNEEDWPDIEAEAIQLWNARSGQSGRIIAAATALSDKWGTRGQKVDGDDFFHAINAVYEAVNDLKPIDKDDQ